MLIKMILEIKRFGSAMQASMAMGTQVQGVVLDAARKRYPGN